MEQLEAIFSLIFHFFVSVHGLYSFYWLRLIDGLNWKSMFFFTIWSLVLQICTSVVLSISDLTSILRGKEEKKSKGAPKIKSNAAAEFSHYKFIIFHLSFVMTVTTGIIFWIIYSIDPTALVPKEFFYPVVLNHMHHTFPWMLAIVQMFIFAKREINSFSLKMDVMQANEVGMGSVFFIGVLYSLTAVASKFIRGVFPYPFMNSLTRIQYGIFNMFGLAFSLMISNISNQILFKIAKSMRAPRIADKNR